MRTHVVSTLLCITSVLTAAGAACGSGSPPTNADSVTSSEAAATFDEFSILWLGESYDSDGDGAGDMRLRTARATHGRALNHPLSGEEIIPAINSFTFAYGECAVPDGDDSCTIPVTIIFYPPDSPELPIPPATERSAIVALRGVAARVYNEGALAIETADFVVTISPAAADPQERLQQSIRIATLLEGANALASHITRDTNFRPKPASPPPAATAAVPTATPTPPPPVVTGDPPDSTVP